jgi:hypothetical protein
LVRRRCSTTLSSLRRTSPVPVETELEGGRNFTQRPVRDAVEPSTRTCSEMDGGRGGRPAPVGGQGRLGARSYRAGFRLDVAEITDAGREWSVAMISELSLPWR